MMTVELPGVFDPSGEDDKVLERAKKKASKNFRWTSSACLMAAEELAFLCHVLGRDGEALEVARFVGGYEFGGNYSLWSPVEGTLALQARLARQKGDNSEADECVRRVRAAGFVASRLDGSLLNIEDAERAEREGRKSLERDYRLGQLHELFLLIELGGSKKWPVSSLEKAYQDNLARLRVLLGGKAS
jgi:hypothetical protein